MGKGLITILKYKCPNCGQSKLYKEPFNYRRPLDMNHSCEQCGLVFEPEPGYFLGAFIVSYIFSILVFAPMVIFLVFVLEVQLTKAMLFAVLLTGIGYFRILRTSRSLWLYFTTKIEKKLDK